MARTVQDANLGTRAARAKLAVAKKPYYRQIDPGRHLGYYKGARGGSWTARRFLGAGKYEEAKLGTADDIRDADGVEVLSFAQAQAKAREWFERRAREEKEAAERAARQAAGEPDPALPYTVQRCMADYLDDYRHRGGKSAKETETRINALILPQLGDLEVKRLTAKKLKEWLDGVAAAPPRLRTKKTATEQKARKIDTNDPEAIRRRRATANRTLNVLKAALNHAWQHSDETGVTSDEAWRKVKPYREADAARVRYLARAECTRLVNASPPDFRKLVQAALLTGARYSELAALQAADFNPDAGTVLVRASKAGKARHIELTDEGVKFFKTAVAGKAGDEPILTRENGTRWRRDYQQRPIREACTAGKIKPAASFHILRHTYASLMVMDGVPLMVVAKNLGHADTRMVEKHYGHLSRSYIRDSIRAFTPLGIVEETKVSSLNR
ncbi:tyrosine-type recombinase/integrase [Azospirillum sp.]|uniref:tyrosine-type recombinase/integrase n=1 Tax=Azospirillum sp. TaxID=34012 RepID=UPI003D733F9F